MSILARIDYAGLNCDLIVDRLKLGLRLNCVLILPRFRLNWVYILVRLRLLLWIDLIYIIYICWLDQDWIKVNCG